MAIPVGTAPGMGSAGGPVERSWPVQLGKPLSKGLWRVALSLKPPLPGGVVVRPDGKAIHQSLVELRRVASGVNRSGRDQTIRVRQPFRSRLGRSDVLFDQSPGVLDGLEHAKDLD